MGLLDELKPQAPRVRPREITVRDRNVVIAWTDGRSTPIDMRVLRQRCPCASCVDEWSGRRMVDPVSIAEDVRPVGMHEVGRYAVQIDWSDGHSTGIYSWDMLGRLVAELEAAESTPPTSA